MHSRGPAAESHRVPRQERREANEAQGGDATDPCNRMIREQPAPERGST